ncbi:hypothetical protein C0J52_03600 [Blattella germanica]|nr:hypothetical protein C0J52_03600 [Blattella germanica]
MSLFMQTVKSETKEAIIDENEPVILKFLGRRQGEPELNQVWDEMNKAKAEVEMQMLEYRKAEETARAVDKIFEEATVTIDRIAAAHIAANENAAKAAANAMNAQMELAKHDSLLSEAKRVFNTLKEKYLMTQIEILKAKHMCVVESTKSGQAQPETGVSNPEASTKQASDIWHETQPSKMLETQQTKTAESQQLKMPEIQQSKIPEIQQSKMPETQQSKMPESQQTKTKTSQNEIMPPLPQMGSNPKCLIRIPEAKALSLIVPVQ